MIIIEQRKMYISSSNIIFAGHGFINIKKFIIIIIVINLLHLCLNIKISSGCIYGQDYYGDLKYESEIVEKGKPFWLRCELNQDYVNNGTIKKSNVFFTKNGTRIYENDTYRIDKSDPYSVTMVVSDSDSDVFGCHLIDNENKTIKICVVDIYVGENPKNVTNFECIYEYEKQLNCFWDLPTGNVPDTSYELFHYARGLSSNEEPCINYTCDGIDFDNLPHDRNNDQSCCIWSDKTNGPNIKVREQGLEIRGKNVLGNSSQLFFRRLETIVRFPEPRNLSFDKDTGNLTWDKPQHLAESKIFQNISYRIHIIDNETNITKTFYTDAEKSKINESYRVDDLLRPYGWYTFNVSIINNESKHWSKNATLTVQMPAKAPLRTPDIIPESFENRLIDSNESMREVNVYWRPVPYIDRYGPGFKYNISVEENGKTIYENESEYCRIFIGNLSVNMEYVFKIYSKNEIGRSKNYSRFVLPANKDILHIENEREQISKTIYAEKIQSNIIYHIRWPVKNTLTHTLFWCDKNETSDKMGFESCLDGTLNWTYTGVDSEYNLTVSDKSLTKRFGIAYNDRNKTTGIISAECMVDRKIAIQPYVPEPPRYREVLIKWKLDCEAERVLVKKFVIMYIYFWRGERKIGKVKVEPNASEYRLTDLEPDTEYNITITTEPELQSKFPEKITIKTPAKRFYFIWMIIVLIVIVLLFMAVMLRFSYQKIKQFKQKNENFSLVIAMEDKPLFEQFRGNSVSRRSRETRLDVVGGADDGPNHLSEHSLVESSSESAQVNTNTTATTTNNNHHNSTNTINDDTTAASEELRNQRIIKPDPVKDGVPYVGAGRRHNESNRRSRDQNQLTSDTQFCSSDSGVSDMTNHFENFEYFASDDCREPFLKKKKNGNSPPIKLMSNSSSDNSTGNGSKSSSSAPNSSLSSPEHRLTSTDRANNSLKKPTYVMIPSSIDRSSASSSKHLPHSHATELPYSYNVNQV